jgi:glucose-1-phosphate thymidylyltransferase
LLPVYDKPMIYYPLALQMQMGIKDILIISTPRDLPNIRELLGDGKNLGINLQYIVQPEPKGIAQAFVLGADFIGSSRVCLVLGDNIFYGSRLSEYLNNAAEVREGGCVLAYHVKDPERYGVVEFDKNKTAISIEEKPLQPKSNYAVTGIYFYDNDVVRIAKELKPSARGELEITDVNRDYLARGKLKVEIMGRGMAWLDTGTPESLMAAAQFIKTIEDRQGQKIGCIEEIAYNNGHISEEQLKAVAAKYKNNDYGNYLLEVIKEQKRGG